MLFLCILHSFVVSNIFFKEKHFDLNMKLFTWVYVGKKNLRFLTRGVLYNIMTEGRNSSPLQCTGIQFYDPSVLIFPFFEMTILL